MGEEKQSARIRLSQRYPWGARENRLTQALNAAAHSVADLSLSNPTQAGFPVPDNLWVSNLANSYSPSAQGDPLAREAIARYYEEEFARTVEVDQIQLCASTSEAYSYCLKLLADPGDEVLVPQPSYPLLEHLLRSDGVVPVAYLFHGAVGQWILDREQLQRSLGERTRAIVIVHPNNPTGHFFSEEDFLWLQEILPREVSVICDEVFADYGWTMKGWSYAGAERTFVLSGLSKLCLLPQMKLGWIVMPKDPQIRRAMEFIGDTYLSVSAPVAAMVPRWLAHRTEWQAPLRARCRENLTVVGGGVDAGWTAIVRGNGGWTAEERVLRMIEFGFWLQPGFYFDLPQEDNYVVSLLTRPDTLRAGLAALNSF